MKRTRKWANHRNSIFIKMLVPTIAVMLFQVILVSLVLNINGTIHSMEKAAKESLYRNAENRSITLENMMVRTWADLDKLEVDVASVIRAYMQDNGLSPGDVFGDTFHEKRLMAGISGDLLYTMRMTSTTGAFMFFVDEASVGQETAKLVGLYYRDYNPNMTSADFSDVLLEKGSADIAQKINIPLSSLWSEFYTVHAASVPTWEAIFAPYKAAVENPKLRTKDLALWSDAHFLDSHSKLDVSSCIAYTRPLFFEGELVGVIGIEVQIEYLKSFFPYEDIGDMGGYMLLRYQDNEAATLDCTVGAVTGSYIKRLADFGGVLSLERRDERNIYRANAANVGATTAAVHPLNLYNTNAPFSDRQWGLAALMPEDVLLEDSAKIRSDILSSSLIALALGCVLIVISVRLVTKPLLNIAEQIRDGSDDDLVVVKSSSAYEVSLLCDTINEMKQKRMDIEIALREEGERYMLALESAIDTFIEYDVVKDSLRIYFFAERNQKRHLTSAVFENFNKDALYNDICHPADVREFLAVLFGRSSEACEMRLRADLFPSTEKYPSDEGFYWFSFKAVQIRPDGSALEKTIGSATQITREKLDEFARREAARRDATTGAYNREYGELLIQRHSDDAAKEGRRHCLIAIVLDNFESFEAYYGRVFSAAILQEVSRKCLALSPALHSVIRWGNAEFVAFCSQGDVERLSQELQRIRESIYCGENAELKLAIYAGVTYCGRNWEADDCLQQAFTAAYACEGADVEMLHYDEKTMLSSAGGAADRGSAHFIGTEISPETVVGFAFSLFEHTSDVKSVIHMLIRVLGRFFSLDQIIICEYDEDFGSNQVTYQWAGEGVKQRRTDMERIEHSAFGDLSSRLDERGVLLYDSDVAAEYGAGVRQLLCIEDGQEFSALCCAMYENGMHTGRALFVSLDKNMGLSDADIFSLYEVTKIISTRFNLEKSNSASRAKSEFLSKMSHEIRTPMNAIIGLTRIAKDAGQDIEQIQGSLDKIDFSAKHLLSLINDILDMSRIESGKMKMESVSFSLASLVRGMDTLMRPQFEEKKIAFTIVREIECAGVMGDEQKLRQVLINLLGNACKFTHTGGEVTLRVSQQVADDGGSCTCLFSVLDTGIGIAKEDRFAIFNAFEQSASGNAQAGQSRGTGLGLAISNSYVSEMGGRISLVSERGKGSEFFFTLSLGCDGEISEGEEEEQESKIEPRAVPVDLFEGKRVLIVDDNEINLEVAMFIIEEIGFLSETATNGKEAVEKFFASEPGYYDIIFMDISMPVMDGLSATREIRRNAERADSRTVPIIAMTANAFSEDTRKSIEAGMNAHVAKPIDVEYLYATLEALFTPEETGAFRFAKGE